MPHTPRVFDYIGISFTMICLLTMLLFFCCTIFPRMFCNVFLHVAHVQLHMLFVFVFRITHNAIYSVSYTIYVNYVYSNLFVLDRVHIPLYGITAPYCFLQPGSSSAVARRRGGGLRCLSGFWMSCGWRVPHPGVWRGATRASASLPSTPCRCIYCTFYI